MDLCEAQDILEGKNQIELNQTELINGDEVFRKIAKKFDK